VPLAACTCAPPSSSMLTSSPVTSLMTSGPVTNMYDFSVAISTSVLTGAYTDPAAHLPSMIDTCGTKPDSLPCLRLISAYQAREVTASWMRAPPESLIATTGQALSSAKSSAAATLRPNISPTEPPKTVWSWAMTTTGLPSM